MRARALIALTAVAGGCLYHLDPLVQEGSAYLDPALVGVWESDSERAVITAIGSGYQIVFSGRHQEDTRFHGRLGRLGEQSVLEVWPAALDPDESWPVARYLILIRIDGDVLVTRTLSEDSMLATVQRDPGRWPHLYDGSTLVLTAPREVLAAALAEYLLEPGALDDPQVWRRAAP
jgi:hypothetical protein